MEKKIYVKPEAEHIVFYSEEEIANMQLVGDGDGGVIGGGISGVENPGWGKD